MSDERALAQQAEAALDVTEQTLLYIQSKALRQLLAVAPDQRDLTERLIAKAQVVQEVIDVLRRTVTAGDMARARDALDEQGITAG